MPYSKLPKPLSDLNMGPSSALFRAPLKPKVTTNEVKKITKVMEGLRMCIRDAQTAASNHLRVHNAMF